ncbi:hypothetical protein BDW66DRAFT_144289 [Aspergillus desertorum]
MLDPGHFRIPLAPSALSCAFNAACFGCCIYSICRVRYTQTTVSLLLPPTRILFAATLCNSLSVFFFLLNVRRPLLSGPQAFAPFASSSK